VSKCPLCKSEGVKVIYMALPMKLCSEDHCNCLWGFWSDISTLWFTGVFMEYKGAYLPALFHWLFGDVRE